MKGGRTEELGLDLRIFGVSHCHRECKSTKYAFQDSESTRNKKIQSEKNNKRRSEIIHVPENCDFYMHDPRFGLDGGDLYEDGKFNEYMLLPQRGIPE